MRIPWSTDVGAGAWIAPRLHPFGADVGAVVPDGFAAYARLLHPARRGQRKLRWRELAAAPLDRATQYEELDPPAGVEPPLLGSLERDELDALIAHLTGPAAWFAVWDGFGWLGDGPDAPRLEHPHRSYLLYHGPVAAAALLHRPPSDRSPNLWWADDRSWCVASEIDLPSTYVGGPPELIDALLHDTRLEALPAAPTDRI